MAARNPPSSCLHVHAIPLDVTEEDFADVWRRERGFDSSRLRTAQTGTYVFGKGMRNRV